MQQRSNISSDPGSRSLLQVISSSSHQLNDQCRISEQCCSCSRTRLNSHPEQHVYTCSSLHYECEGASFELVDSLLVSGIFVQRGACSSCSF
jgi:hypothetical protein